jgi:ACS family hexuronate transporter-like MFS transporter
MCALLFFATTINYMDRIVLSVLSPVILTEMNISKQEYGHITSAFQLTYTLGFIFFGWFVDRFGTRVGYAVSVLWWSVAAALHSLARTGLDLAMWRAMLGLGEAGNFPTAIKSVAEWFPKKERALACGIFNSGASVAAMVGPPLFVWMNSQFGWRTCFFVTGASGLVWLAAWLLIYRLPGQHPKVNAAELAHIHLDQNSSDQEPQMTWAQALRYKETWGFGAAKFFADPVWWFYLYWLPPYFSEVRGFKLADIGWVVPVIYLMADLGSVFGGWLSGYWIGRGWEVGKARKMSLLVFACCMPIGATCVLAKSPVLAVALISLATGAHQAWSANLFTTASDVFPKSAVATVTSIGGCLGGFGGVLFTGEMAGYVSQNYGFTPIFLIMGAFHLTGLAILHWGMGDLKPLRIRR